MCNRLVHLQSDCETIVQGCMFGLAGSRAARGGGERPPDASVAIRTWSACGACPPTRESWDYGVRAGEKARGKWSGRVPGVSGAASPRGGRSRTSYRSRYNYRYCYRYRRGIAASRAFRGFMQNEKKKAGPAGFSHTGVLLPSRRLAPLFLSGCGRPSGSNR